MPQYIIDQQSQSHIAAIDIGSNALRAVIARVTDQEIDILRSLRFPLRLGDSVFRTRQISPNKIRETEEAFIKLLHLFSSYGVQDVRALATSAMRDAHNSEALIQNLKHITGIEIKTISGEQEAALIFHAVKHQLNFKNKPTVLMDIGGGSTEISVVSHNKLIASHSFNIGTVRLLRFKSHLDQQHQINDTVLEMSRFVVSYLGKKNPEVFIGTGGNLRRIGKIRREILKKPSTECNFSELKHMAETLHSMELIDRVKKLKLDPNRADVIVPATFLTYRLMEELKAKKILLPKVGLKEGILLSMLDNHHREFLSLN
jgi:exopolyphosphatase / guanosine-5'-triphosphate,3'-diphosphate pyrophosphatase